MAKKPKTYLKLAGPTSSVGHYSSVWLGPDHLLIVKSTGYSEEYQRMFFRDIKGVFIIDSDRRLYWGIFWGLLVALSLAFVWSGLRDYDPPYASVYFLVMFLGASIWNYLAGHGCRVFVATGVQTARLPAIVRRPKARKVLARVTPLIEAAQKDLATASPALAAVPEPQPPPLV
jgi:hypothetical protein